MAVLIMRTIVIKGAAEEKQEPRNKKDGRKEGILMPSCGYL